MKRRIAAALLLAVMIMSLQIHTALADPNSDDDILIKVGDQSDNVLLLQMRLQDLGYYNYKITGFFGEFTKNALTNFQKTNGIKADGVAGAKTLDLMYGNDAKRNLVVDVNPPPKPKPVKHKYGQYLDWFKTVQYMWKRGMTCKVVDFDTNISYNMVRVGGIYHADVAPATKADNVKFIKTYTRDGGSYPNWDRRAVIVYINGAVVAGSTNGYPHGSTGVPGDGMTNPNGSKAQVCIHFLRSKTHVHNMMDPAHQYEVRRAAGLSVGSKPALADN